MLWSLAGADRPDCAPGMGAPDAKQTKTDAIFSGAARRPSTSGAAKGALVKTAATSSSVRAERLAAAARSLTKKDDVIDVTDPSYEARREKRARRSRSINRIASLFASRNMATTGAIA
jgi:hypothetical protein